MDITSKYIKMCEGAVGIQEKFQLKEEYDKQICTIFYRGNEKDIRPQVFEPTIFDEWAFTAEWGRCIWLPRQDQLQEMVRNKFYDVIEMESFFRDFIRDIYIGRYGTQEITFEQLWLAFIMKEKYNKIWAGEEWETNE